MGCGNVLREVSEFQKHFLRRVQFLNASTTANTVIALRPSPIASQGRTRQTARTVSAPKVSNIIQCTPQRTFGDFSYPIRPEYVQAEYLTGGWADDAWEGELLVVVIVGGH